MNAKEDVAWIQSRIEGNLVILKFLVRRLHPKQNSREEYHRVIDEAIARGYNEIILNFSKLRYTNHTWGLFQLIFFANSKLKDAGGRLVVCGMKGHVRRVFRFANLDRLYPAFRSEKKAIEYMTHQSNGSRIDG